MYRRITCPTEHQECVAFIEWVNLHPNIREYLIKHVNEGKRSRIGGYLLNLIGMRKGLPDYQLPIANKKYIGLWIEMKRTKEKDKKQKKEQIEWINRLLEAGHYATFCYGATHAIKVTLDYLKNKL